MNIGSILNSLISDYTQQNRYAARTSASSSFGEQVIKATPKSVVTDIPTREHKSWDHYIYAGGDALGQYALVEYTEDSTEVDPIVRIQGVSLSGEYDYTIHINDIDASNATYPELCALEAHLEKTGQYQSSEKHGRPLPSEVERGDYSKWQDFTQSLRGCISKNQRYNPNVAALAKELLSLYENFAAEHADKTDTYTANQLDALLDTVGRTRIENNW